LKVDAGAYYYRLMVHLPCGIARDLRMDMALVAAGPDSLVGRIPVSCSLVIVADVGNVPKAQRYLRLYLHHRKLINIGRIWHFLQNQQLTAFICNSKGLISHQNSHVTGMLPN
jgi:hypothetical protein